MKRFGIDEFKKNFLLIAPLAVMTLSLALASSGCSTMSLKSKYARYVSRVNEEHDKALVPPTESLIAAKIECQFSTEDTCWNDYTAKIKERYAFADPITVQRRCGANPIDCRSSV